MKIEAGNGGQQSRASKSMEANIYVIRLSVKVHDRSESYVRDKRCSGFDVETQSGQYFVEVQSSFRRRKDDGVIVSEFRK